MESEFESCWACPIYSLGINLSTRFADNGWLYNVSLMRVISYFDIILLHARKSLVFLFKGMRYKLLILSCQFPGFLLSSLELSFL